MQNLGISDRPQSQDNILKRLFWPSDSPEEMDALGQQGMWVCLVAALSAFVTTLLTGHWVLALLVGIVFFLGGIGIREHSFAASILLAVTYLLDRIAALFLGMPPGFLGVFLGVLLIANVRGTYLAARWQKKLPSEDLPTRWNETWRDKLVDQLPALLWPNTKIIFFVLSGVYLLLTVLGTFVVIYRMHLHAR
jgi:hypothetical protein